MKGVRLRTIMAICALVLLSTFVIVPSSDAAKDRCDDCGNSCWMDYQSGWSDCAGSPAGCLRTVVCP